MRAWASVLLACAAARCTPWPTAPREGPACGQLGEACCPGGRTGAPTYCDDPLRCNGGRCAACPAGQTLCGGVCMASCATGASLDLLLVVDNSNSMAQSQLNLAQNFNALVATLAPEAAAAALSLRVGVVSTDLGTPGSNVPSCAQGDGGGDDGRLNPIGNGAAMRAHQPWTTAPAGARPMRCPLNASGYPDFLTFDGARGTTAQDFGEDVWCNAYLSVGGCGLEQPLEAAYRALVTHDARARRGNGSPNAGFLRDDAALAVVVVSDEEDGSVRDCRYAEPGVPCSDATRVFDVMSTGWASNDLNLRFYLYTPGSRQDPTWPLDRYVDPSNPARGFPGLKPGHPERVFFLAIAGVPLQPPTRAGPTGAQAIDWDALLGTNPDGSDGYAAMTAEGPVSMRQRNPDPGCPTRVVPACRREGSAPTASCAPAAQYVAMPSRRLARVARAFDETWGTGAVSSICRNDFSGALRAVAERLRQRLPGR